jgi:SAM-dependent methyltransferase
VGEERNPTPTAAAPSTGPAAAGVPAAPPGGIDAFLGAPTRDLVAWHWLWAGNHRFPVRSHRGLLGRLVVGWKRLFRPVVQTPQNDLWDRQRVFNLILLEHLERIVERIDRTGDRVAGVEGIVHQGLDEVMRHDDALYARVDAKLDRYRVEARTLLGSLRGALARAEAEAEAGRGAAAAGDGAGAAPDAAGAAVSGGALPLARAAEEIAYVEFERRFRGTEEEIAERLAVYLPHLAGGGPLLDLGCGRGEALRVFARAGLDVRGVDLSAEMVARCREEGFAVEQADGLAYLAAQPAGSLGAVVSFHVVEHLPPTAIERLLALAFAALRPGGVLVLETPNPLSLVVAARNFWLDPTHVRPLHPETARQLARQLGFSAEVLELRPFPAEERLPEIALAEVPEELRPLADGINRMRDRLDDLLFGSQDYALVARKPA